MLEQLLHYSFSQGKDLYFQLTTKLILCAKSQPDLVKDTQHSQDYPVLKKDTLQIIAVLGRTEVVLPDSCHYKVHQEKTNCIKDLTLKSISSMKT